MFVSNKSSSPSLYQSHYHRNPHQSLNLLLLRLLHLPPLFLRHHNLMMILPQITSFPSYHLAHFFPNLGYFYHLA
uniref:Uncharacterized protein n=1 Tax=Triticum urartu TaxID=4572 RepID=A0A8R7PMP7_TRIUA